MSSDPKQPAHNSTAPKTPKVPGDGLDDALNRLEGMLHSQHMVPEGSPDAGQAASQEGAREPEPLPVLEEVIIPGDLFRDEPAGERRTTAPAPREAVPPYADLLNRLASELDIIIESCVDEALANAKQELLFKIKNHLDIVLPEILDEMSRRQADDPD